MSEAAQQETQTDKKNEVTVEELNNLREQVKKKDEEARNLESALQEERRARQETAGKLNEEVSTRFSAQESALENAILAATAEIDGLEKQQTQLMEEGKFGEASKISRLIASAQYKLDGATQSKSQLETYKQTETRKAEAASKDPLAQYSDAAKSWIRRNPAFLSDRKTNLKVMAAHNMAVADDIEVDSPEYFAKLDEAINPRIAVQTESEEVETPAPKVQPKSSTAAPVTRSGQVNGRQSGGGNRIQLTADQAEAALISFPRLAPQDAYVKYAENIKKLQESGRL